MAIAPQRSGLPANTMRTKSMMSCEAWF